MGQAQLLGGQFQVFVKQLLLRGLGMDLGTLQCFDMASTCEELATGGGQSITACQFT